MTHLGGLTRKQNYQCLQRERQGRDKAPSKHYLVLADVCCCWVVFFFKVTTLTVFKIITLGMWGIEGAQDALHMRNFV